MDKNAVFIVRRQGIGQALDQFIRRIDPEIAAISTTPSNAPKTLPSPAPTHRAVGAGDPMASALLPSVPAHDPLPVIPEDGRDATAAVSERHVHMYRGRPVGE